MATGYHKAECATCNKETWHYTSELGQTICCYHSNNMVKGRATSEVKSQAVRIAGRLDLTLWRVAEDRKTTKVDISNEVWAKDIFADAPESATAFDPNKNYCSFCGAVVDQIHTTTEKKPVITMRTDVYRDSSGEVQIQEKVTSRAETIHACPDCCLNIRKPITVRRV